jgi:TolB protein
MRPQLAAILTLVTFAPLCADESVVTHPLIGYTELQTNLSGGRHANVRTERAVVLFADGTGRKEIGVKLVDDPNAWTQFAGWSPDGKEAIISRGWQDPDNAQWEEEHKTFRMLPAKWLLDSCLVELRSGKTTNITAVDRVSHYNGGLFFLPNRKGLGFTPLINGASKPHVMDLDGRNKRDVSGEGGGFAYGYSASPDGRSISFHDNYQVYVANADGTEKRHINTGHPFVFVPQWSPDSQWLLFVSGEHYDCHPHIVRRNGNGLKKLADRAGYRGVVEFLDVFDFHGGSSDVPAWSADGRSVFYTAKVGEVVELFRVTLDGEATQLTRTPAGSLHYHPMPSPDGKQLLYGSKRNGMRNLFIMNFGDYAERQLTDMTPGRAAMWPHWQPVAIDVSYP